MSLCGRILGKRVVEGTRGLCDSPVTDLPGLFLDSGCIPDTREGFSYTWLVGLIYRSPRFAFVAGSFAFILSSVICCSRRG